MKLIDELNYQRYNLMFAFKAFTDFLLWEGGKWDALKEQAVAAKPPWKIVATQAFHATKHVVEDTIEDIVGFFELVPEPDTNYLHWGLHSLEEYEQKSEALLRVFRVLCSCLCVTFLVCITIARALTPPAFYVGIPHVQA